MENKDVAEELNKLISICRDGVEGYKMAADEAKGVELKSLLNGYVTQRGGFTTALQTEVAQLGKNPDEDGTVAGGLHRGWMAVKSAVTNRDDEAILAECETGEKVAVDTYQAALKHADLPVRLRSMVEMQYNQIMTGRDSMSQLHHQKAQ